MSVLAAPMNRLWLPTAAQFRQQELYAGMRCSITFYEREVIVQLLTNRRQQPLCVIYSEWTLAPKLAASLQKR